MKFASKARRAATIVCPGHLARVDAQVARRPILRKRIMIVCAWIAMVILTVTGTAATLGVAALGD